MSEWEKIVQLSHVDNSPIPGDLIQVDRYYHGSTIPLINMSIYAALEHEARKHKRVGSKIVAYLKTGDTALVLQREEKYLRVLAPEGVGWLEAMTVERVGDGV